MPQPTDIPLGQWIEKGFQLYKNHFGILVLAMLLVFVLSVVSLGILLPPLMLGFMLLTLGLATGRSPNPPVTEIFTGFRFFVPALLFFLVWGIIMILGSAILSVFPFIGQLASLLFCYALQALLLFGLFLIGDKDMGFWEASTESMERVKPDFWPFLGLTVIAGLIGGLGAIVLGIGVIFTVPIQICILTVAYQEVYNIPTASSPVETSPAERP